MKPHRWQAGEDPRLVRRAARYYLYRKWVWEKYGYLGRYCVYASHRASSSTFGIAFASLAASAKPAASCFAARATGTLGTARQSRQQTRSDHSSKCKYFMKINDKRDT